MNTWLKPGIFRNILPRYRFRRSRPTELRVRRQQTAVSARPQNAIDVPVELRYAPKRTALLNPAKIALGIIPILSFALGIWQIKRLKWKVELIDELSEKLEREPLTLPSYVDMSTLPEFFHRKVAVRGHWDHAHTMLLGPRVMDGTRGYHVITPLIRENGSTILVNRGWISEEFAAPGRRFEPSDEVEMEGMLRAVPARNMFTPDNHPENGEWYWVDIGTMAEYAGGQKANVQPVYIEATFEGHFTEVSYKKKHGIPIGKAAVLDVRNSHLSYAVTWFSLSAFTSWMFIQVLFKKGFRAVKGMPRRR